jgi:transposase
VIAEEDFSKHLLVNLKSFVMSVYLKYSVAADVSKDSYSFCFSVIDNQQRVKIISTRSFSSRDFKAIKAWIEKNAKQDLPLRITMEATGVYYEQLAWFLFHEGYAVSVVLPNKSKKYLESLGLKSKTDKIDAKGLAQMGAEQNLELWKPISDKLYELRTLTRNHQSLQELKTVTKNRLHAIEHGRIINKEVVKQLKTTIRLYDKQISQMEEAIAALINQDVALSERISKICKIKGLGLIAVATIVAETDGFAMIKNQRQLVSYAGYDVIENQSGNRVGKTKISKKGNSRIRRIMFMPAFNVVKYHQKPFEALYNRVYKRTGYKMKGYVAVQRKILILIYALWKKNEAYCEDYQQESSGNKETKFLFRQSIVDKRKRHGWKEAGRLFKCLPALDEPPSNKSTEVLFRYQQS